jgi:hypothetical protein
MKKDIIVDKERGEITLSLSLRRRIMARDPCMTITTKMAQTMLENEHFTLDKCLISDIIDNYNANSKHEGSWKFSLVKELPAVLVSEEASEIIEPSEPPQFKKKKTSRKRKKQ